MEANKKKGNEKMLTAEEAKIKTNQIREKQIQKAEKLVEHEWDFIEAKIIEATKDGRYYMKYSWSISIFEEAQVLLKDFEIVLSSLLTNLGYSFKIDKEFFMHLIQKVNVYINWD